MRNIFSQRELDSRIRVAMADAAARSTRVKLRDGEGLLLVVRPNGAASWMLQYTINGHRKDLTLGPWPTVDLKLARTLADDQRRQLAQGIDPLAARREARETRRAAAASRDTVGLLLVDWMAKKACSAVYKGNIEAAFAKDVLPAVGSSRPEDVTRKQILEILRKVEKRGAHVLVRRLRMWLRQMFEFAIDDEQRPLVESSPVPTQQLTSFRAPEHRHLAALINADDMRPLVLAIRSYGQPVVRTGLMLAMHTFTRPTELREADWSEFDLAAGKWVIPASRMKMGREHWVPLSTQVVELLKVHAGVVGDVGWVLPGKRHGKPLSESALGAALDTLGFKGRQTPHGFRATARTIGEEHLGIEARFLEKQLSHEPADKVQAAYNRAEYWADRVKLMQRWSDWVDAQSGDPAGAADSAAERAPS